MSDPNAGPAQLIAALARAQGSFPRIAKDKDAKIQTRSGASYQYAYADLATILQAIRKPLADQELAIWQRVGRRGGEVEVVTVLGHSSGETLQSELSMPSDDRDPRAIASTITYARRYGLIGLLGIAPADEDDDAAAAVAPPAERRDEGESIQAAWIAEEQRQQSAATRQPPPGFYYLDDYRIEHGWHHVSCRAANAGAASDYKTKLESVGALACQAYQDGAPVRIEAKPSNEKGVWWLNKVVLWRPDEDTADDPPPPTDDDMPF